MLIFFDHVTYIRRMFSTRDWARILVFFAFLILGIGIAGGAYALFARGFGLFEHDPLYAYFSQALAAYTMEAAFFIIGALITISSAVSGMTMLFESRGNQFLLSTPVPHVRIALSRFFENMLISCWPLVLIGIPAILAFFHIYEVSYIGMSLFCLTLITVFFGYITLATIGCFAVVRAFGVLRGYRLALIAVILMLAGAYGAGRVLLPLDIERLFHADQFVNEKAPVDLVFRQFQNVPTHHAVQFLFAGTGVNRAMEVVKVIVWILPSFAFLYWLMRKWYFTLLTRAVEGLYVSYSHDALRSPRGSARFPRIFKSPFGALLEKDVRIFFRSGREVSRAFMLIFMLFVYLTLFRRLGKGGFEISPDILSRVLFFNFVIVGYFITTLALRFIFPLISLEGKAAWITFSGPLKRTGIFWEKFIIGIVPVSVAVLALAFGSAQLLNLHGIGIAVFLRIIVSMIAVLCTISFAGGVLWPNFRDRDPDKLSTTMPGLFVTLISLGYVAFASFIGIMSIEAYFSRGDILPPVIIPLATLNLALLAVFLWFGLRRIRTLDV